MVRFCEYNIDAGSYEEQLVLEKLCPVLWRACTAALGVASTLRTG